jgi:hypothetical protein
VIIRNRLLLKKESAFNDLVAYFKENDGLISDATNLKSSFPTKTKTAEEFATYYPFHKYQFDVLQKFLFSSNALVATQIAARGMIITTFDVLRKKLKDRNLYNFTTAHDLCSESQTSPPADLVNKYSNAQRILEKSKLDVDGEKLLKTIHFTNESGLTDATVENITKSYIMDMKTYYDVKPLIEESLNTLVEAKILLFSNNNYKITSNLEGKMLEEMRDFSVELFLKKRELVGYLKKQSLFRQVSVINEDSVTYNFNILTDLEDEIISSNNKNLKLVAYSLFNINGDRQDFVEGLKLDTQYTKDVITLVPNNSRFDEMDKLLEEVKRLTYMEEKYGNDEDTNKKAIAREFATIRDEKEKDLINIIEDAYASGSLIYLFDENLLNKDGFKGTINDVQRKLIKNIYTKRLSKQLSDTIASKILTESKNEKLHKYFSGDEFKFFDSNGNFVGEHLKVIEELNSKIKTRYIDGKSLEGEFSIAPWGYSYGTISTTLAVLFRAGRLVVKHNSSDYFSHQNKESHEVFLSSIKFKNARFKSITKTLSAAEKNKLVQSLLDLNFEKHINEKIDWNCSDFELSDAITTLAEHFISALNTLKNSQDDFEKLFAEVYTHKAVLQIYSFKTTEANYIDKANDFLNAKEDFEKAIKDIVKTEKFIKKNLDKLKGFKRFIHSANMVLKRASINNELIEEKTASFEELIKSDVVANFADLREAVQSIKDEYYKLMVASAEEMTRLHEGLKGKVLAAQKKLAKNYPADLNSANTRGLSRLLEYCEARIVPNIKLEYHTECQNCHFSLSDIKNYIALIASNETDLEMIIGSFVKEKPKEEDINQPKQPKKLSLSIPNNIMTANQYRKILRIQIQAMANLEDNDKIDLTVKY